MLTKKQKQEIDNEIDVMLLDGLITIKEGTEDSTNPIFVLTRKGKAYRRNYLKKEEGEFSGRKNKIQKDS